jgi:uncharacterized protein
VYDKRGAGRSTGANWVVATFDELASDASAGVDYLARRPDIDRRRVSRLRIGSGIPVWEQEVYRTTSMMRAAGYSEADIADAERYQRQKFEVSRTGLGWPALDSATKALQQTTKWFADYGNEYLSLSSARFWWLAAYHYDPTAALQHLTIPVLGLFGEKDLSFPIPLCPSECGADFVKAGNCDYVFHIFPTASIS